MISTRLKYLHQILLCLRFLRPLGRPQPTVSQHMLAEVHMAVGRLHLWRAVATLKMFFHHSQLADRVGLMFHLDGTVGSVGRRFLLRHFPDAAFSDFPCQDPRVVAVLQEHEGLRKFYRQGSSVIFRLLPMRILARAPRIISLDSDLAFYACPQSIVDWVTRQQDTLHHLRNDLRGHEQHAPQALTLLASLLDPLPQAGPTGAGIDLRFNAGLMLLPTQALDLSLIDRFCRWHASHQGPRPGFWFHEWNIDQSAMMLVMAASKRATALPESDYFCGAQPARICNHYLDGTYYQRPVLKRMQQELHRMA